ncbi:MAG: sugar ABC transporter permease [Clostridiales bacterium]|jgi:raffinose/stachyose/melibiose transport system permease protein|nr:sugar ABC transporter permease [Clostridiales bacterium]
MDKFLGDKKAIAVFSLPALLFYIGLIFIPIGFAVYYSLLDWNGRAGTEVFIGLKNYLNLFSPADFFPTALKNAAILAVLSVFVQIPIALLLALVIAKNTKFEGFFRSVYFIPVIISTTVLGQLWQKIYHANFGVLNAFLEAIGLESWTRGWLADPNTVLGALFFVMIWQYIGYHMLLMYSQIKSIPTSLYEAAEIDGANGAQLALKITIPLIMPMIKVCVTFSIIGCMKTFDLVWVLTKGGPYHLTEVPTTVMFDVIIRQMRFGAGSAMAIFIMGVCLVLTLLIMRFFKVENYEY